jgi:hypothetical protein
MMPKHLRGRPLFGEDTSYRSLRAHVERGDEIKILSLADEEAGEQEYYTYDDLADQYEDVTVIPLFILRSEDELEIVSEKDQFRLRPEDRFVALVGRGEDVRDQEHRTPSVDQTADDAFEVEETVSEE